MTDSLDFQTIILRLLDFWAARGCLIWQPYHTEVGAGTMNPATFLAVLGPEPWNVAYVEPSIRPDDGRYGENPNRLYQHYQMQVILKPDPGNPQEIYLQSLEVLGIDPREHDIRFVEDNWEAPPIGSWGLGWEVWLDGQEITQFTYFQQAGGINLEPVSVEITYGLDRIAMALQGVGDFKEIRWNDTIRYGDVHLQSEREFSTYAFEIANIDRLRQVFDISEAESQQALSARLVLPALDHVLKCSHVFNVLDTRGAVGVTERQSYFKRMRALARDIAEVYLEQRQSLEYPFLDTDSDPAHIGEPGVSESSEPVIEGEREKISAETSAPFLFEIGTEELPASDVYRARDQLLEAFTEYLKSLRLDYSGLRVEGTPRRLVVYIEDLAERQRDVEELAKGPPADRAYDAEGVPTKAARGFAKSKGVSVDELEILEMDGGDYACVVVRQEGLPASDVLSTTIPDVIASLKFAKTMRWNQTNVAFSRPIRWLLALHGNQVVPFEFAGLSSSNVTRGLRFRDPAEMVINSPEDYFDYLNDQGIILSVSERRSHIGSQIEALAKQVKGTIYDDAELLAEVVQLVEAPIAIRGAFNAEFLELPHDVLIAVMKKHQRYFPIEKNGVLMPYFVTVRNGDEQNEHLVVRGNEDVIHARFADAAYFIREDKKVPLESYLPKLDRLAFQVDLGSMGEKTRRISQLVPLFSEELGLSKTDLKIAERTAILCKADLVSQMVVDMTSLQGIIGRYYALETGEPQEVAQAIFEHYLPRFAGDDAPTQKPGLIVGIADRLDTLAGLFALNLEPTGAKDPFAQRRAALGLVSNLIAWDVDFDLREGLNKATALLPVEASADSQQACLNFIIERLRHHLLDRGEPYDVVDAVLSAQGENPTRAVKAVDALKAWTDRDDWREILPAYARCVRITRDFEEFFEVKPKLFSEEEEKELFAALQTAESTERSKGSVDDFLEAFTPMIPVINRFFDEVLVMDEDESRQQNRLAILQRISSLATGVADMSRLEGF